MYMNVSARERVTHSSRAISWSKAPRSQSVCVTASGIATTFGKHTISTKSRWNSADGRAKRRSSSAISAYSAAARKPITASTHPSLLKSGRLMPLPSDTTVSTGTTAHILLAHNIRVCDRDADAVLDERVEDGLERGEEERREAGHDSLSGPRERGSEGEADGVTGISKLRNALSVNGTLETPLVLPPLAA
eukprot:1625126-Prymnesium_polylepis.1